MGHDCERCKSSGNCDQEETFRRLNDLSKRGVQAMVFWFIGQATDKKEAELFPLYYMAADVAYDMEGNMLKAFADGVTEAMVALGREYEDKSFRYSYYEGEMAIIMHKVRDTQEGLASALNVEDIRMKLAKELETLRNSEFKGPQKQNLH